MLRKTLPDLKRKARLLCLADLDQRTAAAKAAQSLRRALAADLGGLDELSAAQIALVDNAALLGAALGDLGARFLAGKDADLTEFVVLANSQRRMLTTLGLERRAKDVTPMLRDYIQSKRA